MKKIELFEKEYNFLNKEQKEAVDKIYGQIMVVAGPGTGKTQIIGLRTANIILKTGVNPENILITTFTDAGVIAIRKRLTKFLGHEAYKVGVSTIHSFSQDVIKTFPEKFIEQKTGTAIDTVDALEILKKILDDLIEKKEIQELTSDYDKYYYLRTIESKISVLKNEGTSPETFKIAIDKQQIDYEEELSQIKPTLKKYETTKQKQEKHIKKLEELRKIFIEYKKYLNDRELYDFNDMINFVLEKFKEDEELKNYYAEKYQFIMIDEFQDTNNAQNQIIDLILSVNQENPNIMVVGDDDQSIYRFQGANIENMLSFSSKYPETDIVVLEKNYRSNQHILDLASNLISNNNERLTNKISSINKKLISSGPLKEKNNNVLFFRAITEIEEQAFILEEIKKLISSGEELNEIAIIVRNNREVDTWGKLLLQNGIEIESKHKTNILNSNYVKFILNLLKIIDCPFCEEEKIINIFRNSINQINNVDIFKINRELYKINYSKKHKIKFIEYLNEIETKKESFSEEHNLIDLEKILDLKNKIIDYRGKIAEIGLKDFLGFMIKDLKIIEFVEKNGDFDDVQDIYTLFNKIKEFIENNKYLNIEKLLEKIDLFEKYNLSIPRQILKENKSGVQVLTAHSSKGLEYNSVFVPGLYSGNWEGKKVRDLLKLPIYISGSALQSGEFEQIEEDRRLFFVAVTRARKNLFLSYPSSSGAKILLQSVFIEEINDSFKELEQRFDENSFEKIVENDIKNNLIKNGDLELEYIEDFLETYRLSASDLNVFLENPMKFLEKVVYKYPFEDNKNTIFGKVYHRTLELFYLKYKKEGTIPEKSYLTATFKYLIEKEVLNPEEFENLTEKGIKGLEGYYDLYSKTSEIPLDLEYSFRRKNIFFENIPITGIIDKIEKTTQKSQVSDSEQFGQFSLFRENVKLIDYKTGRSKSIGEIKGIDKSGNKKEGIGEGNYFRQLLFYKLLCEMDYETNSKYEVCALAIDFVEGRDGNYKYVEVDFSDEDFSNFKQLIKDSWEKISNMDYWREVLEKAKEE
ncbi:ATP-dependent helicase [Candidatus Gracilibacteria bacterium]|nr:MAG: ATP-dependent helicase [Candidatus Gracilibacteria bacterium]